MERLQLLYRQTHDFLKSKIKESGCLELSLKDTENVQLHQQVVNLENAALRSI